MPDTQHDILEYGKVPQRYLQAKNRQIADFTSTAADDNIDLEVVKSFGEEWNKFHHFSENTLALICKEYFDIVDEKIVNPNTVMIDIGCGSGRWSKYFTDKVKFIEAVDPSDAVFAADELLAGYDNVRITKASINTLPWPDESFDFGMSVGVLHHVPDTRGALADCVKKIKKGGYFYVYLYYNLENRGQFFKTIFYVSNVLRRFVSKLPSGTKKLVCDVLAIVAYMPFVLTARLLIAMGFKKTAANIPLYAYANKDFYIIRNDSLDRFGTKLEQRFTREQIITMMTEAGLSEITFGEDSAFWHALGKKI